MNGERIREIAKQLKIAYDAQVKWHPDLDIQVQLIEQAIRQALVEHNEECAKLAELQALDNCRHLRKEFEK